MDYTQYLHDSHQRFENYRIGRELYAGNHANVFKIGDLEYYFNPKIDYLTFNFPEVLTNHFANLIWSTPPDIDLQQEDNQQIIDIWMKSQSTLITLRECSETASQQGDAIVRLRIENDQILLEQIDNALWFPIFSPHNPNVSLGHILRYQKEKGEGEWCVLLEVHTKGKVEYFEYEIENHKYVAKPLLTNYSEELKNVLVQKDQNYYMTDCDLPLIFHLKNNSISNDFFGVSDYSRSLIAKLYAVNQNLNQIQYVLRRHAHPKMIVPKKLIAQASKEVVESDEKALELGFTNASVAAQYNTQDKDRFTTLVGAKIIQNAEFLGTAMEDVEAKYITWNGNLNESREQINKLVEMMHQESQLSKILIEPESAAASASGIGVLRMAQTSIWKAEKKQSYLKSFIQKIVYTVLQLSQKLGQSQAQAEYPDVTFRQGLVSDLKEVIENQTAMLDAGIQSKVDAIVAVKKISDEKAAEEYEKIQVESNLFGGDNPIIRPADV
jgi:hypothetical protein